MPDTYLVSTADGECLSDISDSKYRAPCLDGYHRWREDISSGQSNYQGWFLAGHEGQLDHVATVPGVCSEVFA